MHFFIQETLDMDCVPDAMQELCPGVFILAQRTGNCTCHIHLEFEDSDKLLKDAAGWELSWVTDVEGIGFGSRPGGFDS